MNFASEVTNSLYPLQRSGGTSSAGGVEIGVQALAARGGDGAAGEHPTCPVESRDLKHSRPSRGERDRCLKRSLLHGCYSVAVSEGDLGGAPVHPQDLAGRHLFGARLARMVKEAHTGSVTQRPGVMLEVEAGAGALREVASLATQAPEHPLGSPSTRYTVQVFREEMSRFRAAPGHRSIELMGK